MKKGNDLKKKIESTIQLQYPKREKKIFSKRKILNE